MFKYKYAVRQYDDEKVGLFNQFTKCWWAYLFVKDMDLIFILSAYLRGKSFLKFIYTTKFIFSRKNLLFYIQLISIDKSNKLYLPQVYK